MTPAQIHALTWLADHGGRGTLDRYGKICAAGSAKSRHDAQTWLRLLMSCHLMVLPECPGLKPALGLTQLGFAAIAQHAA